MTDIFIGDTPQIVLDTGQDCSTASKLQIEVLAPDDTMLVWAASCDGASNYKIVYNASNGDFFVDGSFKVQAYVEWGEYHHHGDIVEIPILAPVDYVEPEE